MAEGEPPAGLLLLDKPAGPSSFAAIASLRRVLGRKLGHAGTLDPFATGLLLVLCGRATRLAPYLSGLDKRYRATVQLGTTTTTDDPEGERRSSGAVASAASIRDALPALRGELEQVPPAASAIHVDGVRAYERFRRGEAVSMPPRRVVVHALELVSFDEPSQAAEVDVHCSTGTYVRALARDLGALVGTGAYCAALRRTAVGPFAIAEAATTAAVLEAPHDPPAWHDPVAAVPHLATRSLDSEELHAIRHGRPIAATAPPGAVACVADGRLVAVARSDGAWLRPEVVLEAA